MSREFTLIGNDGHYYLPKKPQEGMCADGLREVFPDVPYDTDEIYFTVTETPRREAVKLVKQDANEYEYYILADDHYQEIRAAIGKELFSEKEVVYVTCEYNDWSESKPVYEMMLSLHLYEVHPMFSFRYDWDAGFKFPISDFLNCWPEVMVGGNTTRFKIECFDKPWEDRRCESYFRSSKLKEALKYIKRQKNIDSKLYLKFGPR